MPSFHLATTSATVRGLEPPSQFPATLAFQASLLPIRVHCHIKHTPKDSNPHLHGLEPCVLPVTPEVHINAVDRSRTCIPVKAGCFQGSCSTIERQRHKQRDRYGFFVVTVSTQHLLLDLSCYDFKPLKNPRQTDQRLCDWLD